MKVDIFTKGSVTLTARINPLAENLRTLNVECNVVSPIPWDQITKGLIGKIFSSLFSHSPKKCLNIIQNPPEVLIFSKVTALQIYLLQKIMKSKKTKVIFDLTDAIFLPVGNLFRINIRPGTFHLEKMIKNSDFITVNGHYLLEYVKLYNDKAVIIHDPVDTELFTPNLKNSHDKITIGWEGVPWNHYDNLQMLLNPLSIIAKEYDVRFKIVSYLGDLNVKEMFYNLEKWMEIDYGLKQWVPMNKFPELLSDFDIMVAPLQKTPWYEGKSSLRAGLGMAMGIPVIASPIGEQKYVIKHEVNGFQAETEKEWVTYLSTLIEDDNLRKKMGKEGRKTAEQKLSTKVCGKKLFNILQHLK